MAAHAGFLHRPRLTWYASYQLTDSFLEACVNDIRPFRGLRFDERVAGRLADLLCPPYDVISPSEQAALHEKNPHNVVRLELGFELAEDGAGNNRYTRAAATLGRWLAEGVLKPEAEPAIYLYEQAFEVGATRFARLGVLARLRLEPWSAGVVLPHEETMSGPKRDRLQLMRATRCNLSPLFLLFDDPSGEVRSLMSQCASMPPVGEGRTADGDLHRVWAVAGESAGRLAAALGRPQLYMADGHHRYETALAYRDERVAAEARPDPEAAHNFALVLLVDARDPALVVLPTHRMIRGVEPSHLDALWSALPTAFDVEHVSAEGTDGRARALLDRMRTLGERAPTLGLFTGRPRGAAALTLRDGARRAAPSGRPPLDVDLLQEAVLEPLLGIGPKELAAGGVVSYTRDAAEAIAAVEEGAAQAAFFLNPTRVEQVLETARAGGRMPQKSTYFHPKPATGLVINPLE